MTTPEDIKPYDSEKAKGTQVGQMFDSIAPAYDFMNTAMSFGLHRVWRNSALRELCGTSGIDGDVAILDVACGTGDVTIELARRLPLAKVTGIDLSEGMLKMASDKMEQMDSEIQRRISFSRGDCLKLPFGDNSFDAVTVAYGVRNFENLETGYAEMLRVLKPGGHLCVIELSVPRASITRWGYNLYSRQIIPRIGKMVSGDNRAYTYLPESIAACPQRDDMTALMYKVGFHSPKWRTMTFGTIGIYTATK